MPCDRPCDDDEDCTGWFSCQDGQCQERPPLPCPCCFAGAVHYPGGCTDGLTSAAAAETCGEWQGPGSTCGDGGLPACEGACTADADCGCGCVCIDDTCVTDPCGCCCVDYVFDPAYRTQNACEAVGGVWVPGGTCGQGSCDDLHNCDAGDSGLWRIVDGDGNVHASGTVSEGVLLGVPGTWTPEFYHSLSLSMALQVTGCDDEWGDLHSWSATVVLCGTAAERYPEEPLGGPWPPPPGCDCAVDNDTELVIDPCIPCPEMTPEGAAAGPENGPAVTFTGLVDGEWSNLANWEDADGETPAGSLPTGNVIIEGSVTSTAVAISVGELTIQAGAEFSVAASAADLHCYGAIERDALCEGVFGVVNVSGEAFVYGGGRNNGEIVNALVKFSGDGFNDTDGVVAGDATFNGDSANDGAINGSATFNGGSVMTGTGTVTGNATFNGVANTEGTVTGNAIFNEIATQTGNGAINGNATFTGYSRFVSGTVAGTATFNDNACNVAGTAGTFVPNPPPSC